MLDYFAFAPERGKRRRRCWEVSPRLLGACRCRAVACSSWNNTKLVKWPHSSSWLLQIVVVALKRRKRRRRRGERSLRLLEAIRCDAVEGSSRDM
jgi:hypothetical protein